MSEDVARALAEIDEYGIILLQDARLPSLAILIAGEPIIGSWWGHPTGNRIFNTAGALDDHSDVATFKLVDGKVCFVHRRLWPVIVSIGCAREPWQLDSLDDEAHALLSRVDLYGRVLATRKPVKDLELRLLAASEEVHADGGKHATQLVRWDLFAAANALTELPPVAEAKGDIEAVVQALAEPSGANPRVPWAHKRRRK